VELLVVIAILGVLAGVVVFSVSGITNNSQTSACKTEAAVVRTAVESFRANTGAYPANPGAMVTGYLASLPTLVTYAAGPTYTWTGGVTGTCGSITGIGNP
ncbi:MAG: ral secretion pathway protein, partial [Frankiaceae bacterium]|nr:ral secretion pathway protein [Frankiaceae bacterium]